MIRPRLHRIGATIALVLGLCQLALAPASATDFGYLHRWDFGPLGDGCWYRLMGEGTYDLRLCLEQDGVMQVYVPVAARQWQPVRTYGPFPDGCLYLGDGITFSDRACTMTDGKTGIYTAGSDGTWVHQFSIGTLQIGGTWDMGVLPGYGFFTAFFLPDGATFFGNTDIGRWHNPNGLIYFEGAGGYNYLIADTDLNPIEYGMRDPDYGALMPLWDMEHGNYGGGGADLPAYDGDTLLGDAHAVWNDSGIAIADIDTHYNVCLTAASISVDWDYDGDTDFDDQLDQCD